MTKARGARQILLHGMSLVLAGLLFGLVVPHTPHPRLALGAHIQFEGSGVMFVVIALILLKLPNRVGPKSIVVMLLSAWLTWAMALSEVANAWWGTIQMLPIVARQASATGGAAWQELVVKLTHIAAGLVVILTWTLLLIGFAKTPPLAAVVTD